jgi:hypothetical protein
MRATERPRRRVLTLLHNPSAMGGAERVAVDVALSLDRARYEPLFCAIKRPRTPTREEELQEAGIPYFPLELETIRDARVIPALVRLLQSESIDILHISGTRTSSVRSPAALLARR